MASAIVTGAGGGIGRAVALQLAALGYEVALVGRTAAALEKVATEVRAAGRPALVAAGDVGQSAAVTGIVARVVAEFGRVDVVVNCAGFAPLAGLQDTSDEQWREILAVNLSGAFYMTRAVWKLMERQGGGAIVNISSMAARDPFAGLGAYGAAKAGVNLLTLATAREGAAVGIRALCIAPGAVETAMLRGLFSTEQLPAEKAMAPEEIAGVVGAFVEGTLRNASGETVYLQRR
jgi:NAD(P)-dependent dehydrogenase (short-subunit alcohol dehydrogenase family)